MTVRHSKHQLRVQNALEATLRNAEQGVDSLSRSFDLSEDRIVVFSDQHKGARNRADDFQKCDGAYNAALAHYLARGFILVELGDVEELWEEKPRKVLRKYRRTLELTSSFHAEKRYVRVFGNHDDLWSFPAPVKRHLEPVFGGGFKTYESLRLDVPVPSLQEDKVILMIHGHQGTALSDRWSKISRYPVRFLWRPLQRLTGVSLNTPAKDWKLREGHNLALHRWASSKKNLLLIAGHTHQPIFVGGSLLEQLARGVARLRSDLASRPDDPDLIGRLADAAAKLEWIRAAEGEQEIESPIESQPVPRPSYFNTGCCCYSDGDITGLELAEGKIRLVRWPNDFDEPKPQVLASEDLASVLKRV